MGTIQSYRDLNVWQEAMKLVNNVYELTDQFPKHERFGLASQIQRAAVSIPSNIAEGHARKSTKEYSHHLSFARGSLAELETEIQIAVHRNYISREAVRATWTLCQEVGKMLNRLLRSLQTVQLNQAIQSARKPAPGP